MIFSKYNKKIKIFIPLFLFYLTIFLLYLIIRILSFFKINIFFKDLLINISDALFFFIFIISFLLFIYYLFINSDLKKVEKSLEKLNKSVRYLFTLILELASGNLAAKGPSIEPQTIKSKTGEIKSLSELFNMQENILSDCFENFQFVTLTPCSSLCFIGTNLFKEGQRCADIMGKTLGGKGKVVVLVDLHASLALAIRRKGFESQIEKKFPGIEILEPIEALKVEDKLASIINNLLNKHPDFSGVYLTQPNFVRVIHDVVSGSGKLGKIKIITHDLTKDAIYSLENNGISTILTQNPYAQGYNPLIYLYNHIAADWTPKNKKLFTNGEEVTIDNYKEHWDNEKGVLLTEKVIKSLPIPLEQKNISKIKIASILTVVNDFWLPVVEGAKDAVKKLSSKNVETELIISKESMFDIELLKSQIQAEIDKGCMGIALPMFNVELIPYLNELVEKGITVIIYNSEPLSFRDTFSTISKYTKELAGVSTELMTGSKESSQAIFNINDQMQMINSRNKEQLEHLNKTVETSKALIKTISSIISDSGECLKSVKDSSKIAFNGTNRVFDSINNMTKLKKISEEVAKSLKLLNDKVYKIQGIIDIVQNLTSQTNVLALNASIQASHAGEYGEGFSVIAKEIRALSSESSQSTNLISKLVMGIQEVSTLTTKNMDQFMEQIEKNLNINTDAESYMKKIIDSSKLSEEKMGMIYSDATRMKDNSNSTKEAINMLFELSNAHTSSVEEITSAINQITTQIDSLSVTATHLFNISKANEVLLSQFTYE